MRRVRRSHSLTWIAGMAMVTVMSPAAAPAVAARLKPEAVRIWNGYVEETERRIAAELKAAAPFLVIDTLPQASRDTARKTISAGGVYVASLDRTPGTRAPGPPHALIHHWLGAVLVPGARLADVLAFVQDYDRHARFFDEVVESRTVERDGNRFVVFLRLRRTKVITVTYNTLHEVRYRQHDPVRASSRSVATRVAELAEAGTAGEREKPADEDRGFLMRLHSYWRFEEIDNGVVVECESISLSRDIPTGLGWLVGPFVKAIPRESLERTLAGVREGTLEQQGRARR
jgi:hypothetical protein